MGTGQKLESSESVGALAVAVVAHEIVGRVARVLGREGIEVMPLKGVLLQRWVYADPSRRRLSDVDLMVRPRDFERAVTLLLAQGFVAETEEPERWQTKLVHPKLPLDVDFHQQFQLGRRHRLRPDDVFDRGQRDERLFGAPVVVPDPLDLYAHLVAHFSNTFLATGEIHRPEDFGELARAKELDARAVSSHLARMGLARHARVVLPLASHATGDRHPLEVLRSLPADPMGEAIVRLVDATSPGSFPRRLAALLLNPSAADIVLAAADAVSRRLRGETRSRDLTGP